MPAPSPAITAAIRAIGGESDLDVLMPALADERLARVIALARDAHRLACAIAALCGGLQSLLDAPTVADPAFHDAVARLIGTPAGRTALRAWAEMAPAGWGAAHAEALITAVHANMVDAGVAAALIGPNDDTAWLLHKVSDIAFAIRWWGRSAPNDPTAWAEAIAPDERDRLLTRVQSNPFVRASCLPWLPDTAAPHAATNNARAVGMAIDAFADASPTARARGAAHLRRLVMHAQPAHLGSLTRLGIAMRTNVDVDVVWRRISMMLFANPSHAYRVVAAAPWNDLPETIRAAILQRAADTAEGVAIAAARGLDVAGRYRAARKQRVPPWMTRDTSAAFFAALDPDVWNALDVDRQRRWRQALDPDARHLIIRALGLDQDTLALMRLTADLVRAAQRHVRDHAQVCAALFPVALRDLALADAHALIAAMPMMPPDPGAFFVIAGGRADSGVLAPARSALRTPADLALAVTLQRGANDNDRTQDAWACVRAALRGRTWDDLAPILAILDNAAQAIVTPAPDRIAARLAPPAYQSRLHAALARLASLPPDISMPVLVTLGQYDRFSVLDRRTAAAVVAHALHAHGDVFLDIADAQANEHLRQALLPLPKDAALADALRALARVDPPAAQRLAYALHDRSWRALLLALLQMPLPYVVVVWDTLSWEDRRAIGRAIPDGPLKPDGRALHNIAAALVLTALSADNADLRNAGIAALATHPMLLRAIWMHAPPEVRQTFETHPGVADLILPTETPTDARSERRARRW